MTLKLIWEKEKSLTGHKYWVKPGTVSHAAFCGNKPLLSTLIEMGASLNYIDHYNRTPIMWAAHSGQFDVIKLLSGKGADANLKRDSKIHHFVLGKRIRLVYHRSKRSFLVSRQGGKEKDSPLSYEAICQKSFKKASMESLTKSIWRRWICVMC